MQQKPKDVLALPSIHNIDEVIARITQPINLTKGHYRNLEFHFKDNQVLLTIDNKDLKEFSNVWLSSFWESRDLAYAVELYLDHHHVKHTYVEKTTSKITDQILFGLNQITVPNTFFINSPHIQKHILTIENICGYPLIIKDTTGARGKFSVYINNREELLAQSLILPKHKKYLFQQFIANDYDWGILISNNTIVSAEKSYHKIDEFRNHSCNGATEVFVPIEEVPLDIQKMALKASAALDLSWSRADIVVDKSSNQAYLMEVNRCPGISSKTDEIIGAQKFLEAHLLN